MIDRILDAIRAIVREEFPRARFSGLYQYGIKAVSGSPPNVLIDCSPVDQTIGLPELVGLPMQPGISGITSIPSVGLGCVVAFLDGSPTKPIVLGVDSLGVNPVARLGDAVTSFLPPTMAALVTGPPASPLLGTTIVIAVANPIGGVITGGSGKAYSG